MQITTDVRTFTQEATARSIDITVNPGIHTKFKILTEYIAQRHGIITEIDHIGNDNVSPIACQCCIRIVSAYILVRTAVKAIQTDIRKINRPGIFTKIEFKSGVADIARLHRESLCYSSSIYGRRNFTEFGESIIREAVTPDANFYIAASTNTL